MFSVDDVIIVIPVDGRFQFQQPLLSERISFGTIFQESFYPFQ